MSDRVRDAIEGYLARMPNAWEAHQQDPLYHAQISWLRRTLTVLDMAMEDEGVPDEVRGRVIRTVLFGSPDEDAAMVRIEDHKRLVEESMRTMPDFGPVEVDKLWEGKRG